MIPESDTLSYGNGYRSNLQEKDHEKKTLNFATRFIHL